MTSQWHNRRMRTILQRYYDGELTGTTARRLETHLSHCASCRATLHAWHIAEQALRQPACRHAPALHNPAAMFASVLAQTRAQTSLRRQTRQRQSVAVFTAAVAACSCWFLLTANHGRRESAGYANNDFAVSGQRKAPQTVRQDTWQARQITGTTHKANDTLRSVSAASISRAGKRHEDIRLQTSYQKLAAAPGAFTNIRRPAHKHNKTIRQTRIATMASHNSIFRLSSASSASLIAEALRKASAAEHFADVMAQRESIALQMDARAARQDVHAPSSEAHLLVAVNEGSDKNRGRNELTPATPLSGIQASYDTSSVALVTFSHYNLAGTQVWNYCDVAHNGRSATTLRYAASWHNHRIPATSLTVTTETVQPQLTQPEPAQPEPAQKNLMQGEDR